MLFFLSMALAAPVTELPPFLRGDLAFGYDLDTLSSGLVETRGAERVDVGSRSVTAHTVRIDAVFAVAPGAAVYLQIPPYQSSFVKFEGASNMVYDPASGSGTYEGMPADLSGKQYAGSGLGGVWLGARGTPFSEAFPGRNNKSTWLLDLGFRIGDKQDTYYVDAAGKRGAGPGAPAVRLSSAFSKNFGNSAPYMSVALTKNNAYDRNVQADSGEVIFDSTTTNGKDFDQGRQGALRIGVDIGTPTHPDTGARFSFDLFGAVDYTSFRVVPSGYYLPGVLSASVGTPTQMAESLDLGGGLGIHWRPAKYVQINLGGTGFAHLPQRVENYYDVHTAGDGLRVVVLSDVTVRFR